MELTSIIGFVGVFIGMMVNVPQIIKSYRLKSVEGVSPWVYILLFVALVCYLTRAVAIGEPVFIISNVLGLTTTLLMLIAFWKYRGETKWN